MQLGPIQLVIIGFENDDNFRGQISRELDSLKGRGVVKLIDAVFAHKNDAGELTISTRTDIEAGDEAAYGAALERLLGAVEEQGIAVDAPPDGDEMIGIGLDALRENLAGVKPGKAIALAIFEHTWAAGLSQAISDAGGRLLTQGILTREAVVLMGDELEAIADAEATAGAAQAAKGATLLDTLLLEASADERAGDEAAQAMDRAASALTTAVAAETLRTLVGAGVVDASEIETALTALVLNELLDPAMVNQGLAAADARIAAASDQASRTVGSD